MKNSARYGLTTAALVLAGMSIGRLANPEGFVIVAVIFPVVSGVASWLCQAEGEGS
jgi:hypothetical protein